MTFLTKLSKRYNVSPCIFRSDYFIALFSSTFVSDFHILIICVQQLEKANPAVFDTNVGDGVVKMKVSLRNILTYYVRLH